LRFKGTLILLIIVLGLGAFIYFYEYKGKDEREKAKQSENQIWKLESDSIRQLDIFANGQNVTLVRNKQNVWSITAPKLYQADADEVNRLANAASDIRRDSVLEENAADLERFGLNPPRCSLKIRTGQGKDYEIRFGQTNPIGSFSYAIVTGSKSVLLVENSAAEAFNKKLDDLRDHTVLNFDKADVQSVSIKNEKGDLELAKDNNDLWWLTRNERVAADSPGIRGILNSLSMARIKEFYPDSADQKSPSIEHPLIDVSVVYGKNRSTKRLLIGSEKSNSGAEKLYLAKNESRPDLFYVDKELVDKLLQSRGDLREKALAVFQRWDVDSISLKNDKGSFILSKSNGEWFIGGKKAKWDAVNGIMDALEKKVADLIEKPAANSKYGLDKPPVQVTLRQANNVVVECSVGGSTAKGVYAQINGDPAVKVIDLESAAKLHVGESDLIEPPAAKPVAPKMK
jgi:hypothetical protein